MGATIAPNVANIFMSIWEVENMFINRPSELKYHWCFIDNIILIWEGNTNGLEDCKSIFNDNEKNIILTWKKHIEILDLWRDKIDECFFTKNFF